MRTLLLTGVLCLSMLGIASAKSYSITLSSPAIVGDLQLKPGDYRVKLEGNNAVFTDVNSAKSFSVPVKMESTNQKYENTTVVSKKDGEVERIEEIDLGGSHNKLDF